MHNFAWRVVASFMHCLMRGKFSWLSLVHCVRFSCFVERDCWQYLMMEVSIDSTVSSSSGGGRVVELEEHCLDSSIAAALRID